MGKSIWVVLVMAMSKPNCWAQCPFPTSLTYWEIHDADSVIGLSDGNTIASWPDESGNNRTITQSTEANKAKWYSNIVATHAVARFDSSDRYPVSAPTSGNNELWVVIKADADPAPNAGRGGSWHFEPITGGAESASYPYTNGLIYEDFGWGTRYSFDPSVALTEWRLYVVREGNLEGATTYEIRVDTTVGFSGSDSQGGYETAPGASCTFGKSEQNLYLDAEVAWWCILDAVTTQVQRDSLWSYLSCRYDLAFEPSLGCCTDATEVLRWPVRRRGEARRGER